MGVESNYDLVIVLDETWKKRWFVGVTTIDQRFTNLFFVSRSTVQAVLDLDLPIEQEDDLAPIVRRYCDAELLSANNGLVGRAQENVKREDWIKPIQEDVAYGAWFRINYNIAQLRRMILSVDSLYQQIVDIRIVVYGTSDLWFRYFTLRNM